MNHLNYFTTLVPITISRLLNNWISNHEISICTEDGWIITQSQDLFILMDEIAELQDNKTNFDVYIHKLDPRNEIDFYDSIIKYYEFKFYAYAKLKAQTASATLTHMIWRVVSTIKAA